MPRHKREHRKNYAYLITKEWVYPGPHNFGIKVRDDVYYDIKNALEVCKKECVDELPRYNRICGDCLPPEMTVSDSRVGPAGAARGYIITAKNGQDPWYFASRVIKIRYGVDFSFERRD